MTYGSELVLVLDDKVVERLAKTQLEEGQDLNSLDRYEVIELANDAVYDDLRKIHKELVENRFGPAKESSDKTTLKVNTPEGKRELWPFHISGFGYEDEPDEVVGISLASRYYPVWVDWRFEHGGGDCVKINRETFDMVEEARIAIARIIPEAANQSDVETVTNFY